MSVISALKRFCINQYITKTQSTYNHLISWYCDVLTRSALVMQYTRYLNALHKSNTLIPSNQKGNQLGDITGFSVTCNLYSGPCLMCSFTRKLNLLCNVLLSIDINGHNGHCFRSGNKPTSLIFLLILYLLIIQSFAHLVRWYKNIADEIR